MKLLCQTFLQNGFSSTREAAPSKEAEPELFLKEPELFLKKPKPYQTSLGSVSELHATCAALSLNSFAISYFKSIEIYAAAGGGLWTHPILPLPPASRRLGGVF